MKYIPSILLFVAHTLLAQSYPLSENTWSNPEFVDRFMGSYGVDTEKSPSISSEEAEVFRQVAKSGYKSDTAIKILSKSINKDSSGAMDFALANFLLQKGDIGGGHGHVFLRTQEVVLDPQAGSTEARWRI